MAIIAQAHAGTAKHMVIAPLLEDFGQPGPEHHQCRALSVFLVNASPTKLDKGAPDMVQAREIKLGMQILDNVFMKLSKKSEGCACSNH